MKKSGNLYNRIVAKIIHQLKNVKSISGEPLFELKAKGNPEDIFFYQPSKARVDTSTLFEITIEKRSLRVKKQEYKLFI